MCHACELVLHPLVIPSYSSLHNDCLTGIVQPGVHSLTRFHVLLLTLHSSHFSSGTNHARLAGLLRQLAGYYAKEPNHLFLVRIAQGLLHLGRGVMTLSPFHADHMLYSKVGMAGLLVLMHTATNLKESKCMFTSVFSARCHKYVFSALSYCITLVYIISLSFVCTLLLLILRGVFGFAPALSLSGFNASAPSYRFRGLTHICTLLLT